MPCFNPQHGFVSATGGFALTRKQSPSGRTLVVPCLKCEGCTADRVAEWSVRLEHEKQCHEFSCMATLTYDDDHLPPFGSLRMRDVSSWMKRLRKKFPDARIRFLAAGEYGPKTFRPHYHVCLFGLDFEDKLLMRTSDAGFPSYVSPTLTETWGLGNCEVTELTPRSARYVAGYVLKKLNDPFPDEFYSGSDPETGEIFERERECARMSNRPGIGSRWLDEFEADVFPSGFVVVDGQKRAVPRYYRKRLSGRFLLAGSRQSGLGVDDAEVMARRRRAHGRSLSALRDQQPDRLAVKRELLASRMSRLKREFDG